MNYFPADDLWELKKETRGKSASTVRCDGVVLIPGWFDFFFKCNFGVFVQESFRFVVADVAV